ncbi:transposase [Pelagibius litoralis]|uniref:Transposase n=1 Tax=Pelagibius litoralis TaxID=374515 RepID=A0A967KFD5_9PROT|nr:transposase [Pelagibius litoralis]
MAVMPDHPKASRYSPPAKNPHVRPHQLDYEWVVTHDIKDFCDIIENTRVKGKAFFACFDPSDAVLDEAAKGQAWVRDGFKRCKLRLPSRANCPCQLILWARVIKLADRRRKVVLPSSFDEETRLCAELVQEVKERLASQSVAEIRRATDIPRAQIAPICAHMIAENRDQLAMSNAAPQVIAVDPVAGARNRREKRALLTMAASDHELKLHFFLEMIDMSRGKRPFTTGSHVVRDVAGVLLTMPNPEALLAITMDGEPVVAAVMTLALEVAAKQNPVFKKVRLVRDRWHVKNHAVVPMRKARLAALRKLNKEIPEEKKLIELLNSARYVLEDAPWDDLDGDPKTIQAAGRGKLSSKKVRSKTQEERRKKRQAQRRLLKRVFKHFPELKPVYEAYTRLRQFYVLSDRQQAEAELDQWLKDLKGPLRRRFQEVVKYLKNGREHILNYFDMKAETLVRFGEAFSLTSGLAESLNREIRKRHRPARAASLDQLRAQMIAAFSYGTVGPREELKREKRATRERKRAECKVNAETRPAGEASPRSQTTCADPETPSSGRCEAALLATGIVTRDGPQFGQQLAGVERRHGGAPPTAGELHGDEGLAVAHQVERHAEAGRVS